MKEEILVNSLKQIKDLLEKHDIEFWLDTGTLLGAAREKKFIAWDYDVDLGALYKELSKIVDVFDEIKRLGYEVCYFPIEKCIKILKENCEIDINLYESKDDEVTRAWYVNNKIGQILDYFRWILRIEKTDLKRSKLPKTFTKILMTKRIIIPVFLREKLANSVENFYYKIGCKIVDIRIPKKYFTNLTEIEFYNTKFKAPSKIEEYLELRYGKDWRTPQKDYVYYRDDGSIVKY